MVVLTIDLNDKFKLHTTEIRRVWWYRILSTKLHPSAAPGAEQLPKHSSKAVSGYTLKFREFNRFFVAIERTIPFHLSSPFGMLRTSLS